jgi:hypothetical protein
VSAVVPSPPTIPSPEFAVRGVRADRSAGVPTLTFDLAISDTSELQVYTVALHVQVHLEPARRMHDEETRARLFELFGPSERWNATAGTVPWMAVDGLVPSFTGETVYPLSFPCGYDHEVAATRYCGALREGVVPIDMHFNGCVYYRGPDGSIQMVLIPWSCVARFDMPWQVWRDAMHGYYPSGGFVSLTHDTMDRLTAMRHERGLKTYDQCITALLEEEP